MFAKLFGVKAPLFLKFWDDSKTLLGEDTPEFP